jgi:hypothetical protein
MNTNGVWVWWYFLCALAVLNIAAWSFSAVALNRRQHVLSADGFKARRQQLLLSSLYVFGCAFRSVFPVFDVPRLGVVDSWLSSAFIGRSVATIAELAFAAQWALLMRETARATGSYFAYGVSRTVLPAILLAEVFSWYSVLTTSNLGHVIEELLWGASAALVVAGMVTIRPRCSPVRPAVLFTWCAAGLAYVAYMFLVDVPTYWSRWVADEAGGRQYLSIGQGIVDAATRRVVTQAWADWSGEMIWMSLYFSVGVWVSISLIHAPAPIEGLARGKRRSILWPFAYGVRKV